MNLVTISEISRHFNISTRTLRYYEQIGLLHSTKKEDYAYRTYDDAAAARLRQIVTLRKLRIPLKQIITILESEDAPEIIETFRQNLNDVDDEITALSTIRTILNTFITRLSENTQLDIKVGLLDDISIVDVVDSLTVTKIAFKGEKTMEELSRASEKLSQLNDEMVRIEYLWPMRVLSSYTKESGGKRTESAENPSPWNDAVKNIPKHQRCDHLEFPNPYCEGQMVEIYRIDDHFTNNTEFVDYIFQGGLFATMVSDADRIGEIWKLLLEWIEKSDTFAADCISKGGSREEIFGIPLTAEGGNLRGVPGLPASISEGEIPDVKKHIRRFQWDLLIPIKIKNV